VAAPTHTEIEMSVLNRLLTTSAKEIIIRNVGKVKLSHNLYYVGAILLIASREAGWYPETK